ncbi:MAG: hypothetical protein ACE5G5_11840 [Candidatus Methylomirabilales bacterium]
MPSLRRVSGSGPGGLVAGAFHISRRFIRASARQLQELCEPGWITKYGFVGLVLNGKVTANAAIAIALGVTLTGGAAEGASKGGPATRGSLPPPTGPLSGSSPRDGNPASSGYVWGHRETG